jgi:hypothetical protein
VASKVKQKSTKRTWYTLIANSLNGLLYQVGIHTYYSIKVFNCTISANLSYDHNILVFNYYFLNCCVNLVRILLQQRLVRQLLQLKRSSTRNFQTRRIGMLKVYMSSSTKPLIRSGLPLYQNRRSSFQLLI